MLFTIIKSTLALSAILFAALIILHKQFTKRVKDNIQVSNFVATIAFSLVIYIVCAIFAALFIPSIKYKILMIIFALSPFIIGKFATYEKIRLYSFAQITIMIVSAIIVWL